MTRALLHWTEPMVRNDWFPVSVGLIVLVMAVVAVFWIFPLLP
jgi:hypothetical protein